MNVYSDRIAATQVPLYQTNHIISLFVHEILQLTMSKYPSVKSIAQCLDIISRKFAIDSHQKSFLSHFSFKLRCFCQTVRSTQACILNTTMFAWVCNELYPSLGTNVRLQSNIGVGLYLGLYIVIRHLIPSHKAVSPRVILNHAAY